MFGRLAGEEAVGCVSSRKERGHSWQGQHLSLGH